jgi:glycosyltransferase involved in cell wall biosynthesis
MRICSPQLGMSPDASLGGEVYDRELLTRLTRMGAEVEVILPSRSSCPEAANLRVTRLPLSRGLRWFVSNPLFAAYIARSYRRRPFDVLRVHSLRFVGLAAVVARWLYRLPVPIIAHCHHLDADRPTQHLERWIARHCDLMLTGSQFACRQIIDQLGIRPERAAVVYYGVDDKYVPEPRDEQLARRVGCTGAPLLMYLGSLTPRKNVSVLISAMRFVLDERPEARLCIVGRGECESELRGQAAELRLSHAVSFAGLVPEKEKVAWYNLADIFVHPSRLEGFGFAAAEAMACGKPVVASRAGSLPEVVADGETGLLCDPDDSSSFSQAILRLLTDRPLAIAMGHAGAAKARREFSWDRCASETLHMYEEAVTCWRA